MSAAAAPVALAAAQLAPALRTRLRQLRRPNWHVMPGLVELVARHLTYTQFKLLILAQEAKVNRTSDWVRQEPQKHCRACETVGPTCGCAKDRDEGLLPADDALGLRLGVTGREVREAMKFLSAESIGLIELEKYRGEGFQFRSVPERIHNIPFRFMRRCRPRAAAADPAPPEPQPEVIPAKLECPVGMQCPVRELIHVDGVMTNATCQIGTPVPSSPPAEQFGTQVPNPQIDVDRTRLEQLKSLIANTLGLPLPEDRFLQESVLAPLGSTPIASLEEVALVPKVRRKMFSAAMLANLVPDATRTYAARTHSNGNGNGHEVPAADRDLQYGYDEYRESTVQTYIDRLSAESHAELHRAALEAAQTSSLVPFARMTKAQQADVVASFVRRLAAQHAGVLSFEEWRQRGLSS